MANNNISPEEQAEVEKSLDLLSNYEDIPAYVVADKLGLIKGTKAAGKAWKGLAEWEISTLNQALFDLGANTYNTYAVPMNLIGQFFGYNPGLSGERTMENLPWEKGIASFGDRPEARRDVDRPEMFFGLGPSSEAPQVPFKEQPLGKVVKAELDKNIPASVAESPSTAAPDTSIAAISYAFDDIDPKIRDLFDKILSSDESTRISYWDRMPEEQRNALMDYQNSLTERQLVEENKRKENLIYNKNTNTIVRKNASNL